MSPHHRTNLLKLIDLAIGSPTPGSVSFNLLHKILYILAVRSGSVEHDEIELGHVGDSTPLIGRALADAEDGRTRLMVQRVSGGGGGGGDDQTLKITGSRIVVPWEQQPLDMGRRKRCTADSSWGTEDDTEEELKSQLSTISSAVSELGERVQEMAQRPDEGIEQLKRRVDALESLVERQMKEISSLREAGRPAEHECDFTKEKSGLWKAIDALQNKIQNFSTVVREDHSGNVEAVVEEDVQQNESLELNIGDANQGPVPNSMNWSMDLSMQQFEELVAKQNRFEQSLESLALGTDACYKDTIVQLQTLNDQLQTIEDSTAAKLEQLERSIERLSQQKANEVEIDSRVRMSIHQARPSILMAPPRTVDIVAQSNPHCEEQLLILTEQIKSTRDDLYDLRESLNGKASTDYMITLESALTDQIKQLQRDLKGLLTSQKATSGSDRAAGSKMKLLQDVGCISCDREVAMRTCEEVIPQPAVLRVNRTVKANLRYQLSEIRKGLELHPGSAASNLLPVDRVYRSIAQGRKINRSK